MESSESESLDCPPKTAFEHLDFILIGVIITIVCLIGVTGNITSLIVLLRKRIRSPFTILLSSLAIWDSIFLLNCLSFLPLYGSIPYFCLDSEGTALWEFYVKLFSVFPSVYGTAQAAAGYLIVFVNIERLIAVYHPLRVKTLCTTKRAIWSVFSGSLLAITVNIPRYMNAAGVFHKIPVNETDPKPDPNYSLYYETWFTILILYMLPVLTVVGLNYANVVRIRKAAKKSLAMQKSEEDRRKWSFTKIVLRASGVYIVCTLLEVIYILTLQYGYHDYFRYFYGFSWLASVLNASLNPIIYYATGDVFKKELCRMFACPGSGLREQSSGKSNGTNSSFMNSNSRVTQKL